MDGINLMDMMVPNSQLVSPPPPGAVVSHIGLTTHRERVEK